MAHANKAEMINKRRSQIHMRDFPLNALMETRTSLCLTFVRYFAPFWSRFWLCWAIISLAQP